MCRWWFVAILVGVLVWAAILYERPQIGVALLAAAVLVALASAVVRRGSRP